MISFDPALPHLTDLLDGDLMGAVLRDRDVAIRTVTPDYLRYKPGTSCMIRYRVETIDGPTWGTVLTDANGKHALRAAKRRLRERPGDVRHFPEMDALWLSFPYDYDLVSLPTVLDPVRFGEAVPGYVAPVAPEVIRFKPGRKALVRHGDHFAKLLTDARGAMIEQVTGDLRRHGVPTPPVAVWLRRWQTLVHTRAAGTPLFDLRASSSFGSWMEPFAEVLAQVHSAPVTAMPRRSLSTIGAEVGRLAAWLRVVSPEATVLVDEVERRLRAALAVVPDRFVPIHGDAYDDQLLVGSNGVWLIDLDELHLGHPLVDIGNVAAHLTAVGLSGARESFLEASEVSRIEVLAFEALGLLRLAPRGVRNLRADAQEEVEKHLRAALALLSTDAALPQLPLIPAAARSVMGDLVSVATVRHKPGRRAIFRFETANGVAWGKTFASARGPKVVAVLERIVAARPFGDDVVLPEPLAWLPEAKLLLQRPVPGQPLDAPLLRARPVVMAQVAWALATFHASGLDLGRIHPVEKELAPIVTRLDDLEAVDTDLATRGRAVLAATDLTAFAWRSRPIHRDCYHEQMTIDGDRLGILDLDDAAMSEPAIDVANVIAHLHLLESQAGMCLGAAIGQFRSTALALDDCLDPLLVEALIATTALRLAGIHILRDRGGDLAAAMIALAERISHERCLTTAR